MRISDTKSSSMILSQTKWFNKLSSDVPNMPKQSKAKLDCLKTYNITISINPWHKKFGCSQKRFESTEVDRRT